MPERLYWNTVNDLLKHVLTVLMEHKLFHSFRLVGGTSLSLQIGHRMSDDIDLFTDATYESIDFEAIDKFFRDTFGYVSEISKGPVGMGLSYLIGTTKEDAVKLDLYYVDPFIQPAIHFGVYRLATVEEIIAMKVDIVQRKGRKKDFWDIHELMERYTFTQMIELHKKRYPYNHDAQLIIANLADFEKADRDFEPRCLRGKYWEFIKLDIVQAVQANKD
jgi:predicted nucleotidyltransferase component of viral defense system